MRACTAVNLALAGLLVSVTVTLRVPYTYSYMYLELLPPQLALQLGHLHSRLRLGFRGG